jgi:DNA-binding HxlR family transcriptional regulator
MMNHRHLFQAVSNFETQIQTIVSERETQPKGEMAKSATPVPGSRVRGSNTGRPLMAAMDLLGKRWTLRILWELRDTSLGARSLQERCDAMSSSVLYERLRELTDARLVRQTKTDEYELTALGASLQNALDPLDAWSKRWAKRLLD